MPPDPYTWIQAVINLNATTTQKSLGLAKITAVPKCEVSI